MYVIYNVLGTSTRSQPLCSFCFLPRPRPRLLPRSALVISLPPLEVCVCVSVSEEVGGEAGRGADGRYVNLMRSYRPLLRVY